MQGSVTICIPPDSKRSSIYVLIVTQINVAVKCFYSDSKVLTHASKCAIIRPYKVKHGYDAFDQEKPLYHISQTSASLNWIANWTPLAVEAPAS